MSAEDEVRRDDEIATLRARLAAAERVVEALRPEFGICERIRLHKMDPGCPSVYEEDRAYLMCLPCRVRTALAAYDADAAKEKP